jgi:hypothetical protein
VVTEVQTVEHHTNFYNYDVRLTFPTARTEILPDFGNNRVELNRIEETLSQLRSRPELRIIRIELQGYASPEGGEAANLRYADGRARALMYYLQQRLNLPSDLVNVASGGEDWAGLAEQVKTSVTLAPYRYELDNIINLNVNADQKERVLRRLDGGKAYRLLNDYIFPQLRRVVCRVEYVEE